MSDDDTKKATTRDEAIAWAKAGEPAPDGPLAWRSNDDPPLLIVTKSPLADRPSEAPLVASNKCHWCSSPKGKPHQTPCQEAGTSLTMIKPSDDPKTTAQITAILALEKMKKELASDPTGGVEPGVAQSSHEGPEGATGNHGAHRASGEEQRPSKPSVAGSSPAPRLDSASMCSHGDKLATHRWTACVGCGAILTTRVSSKLREHAWALRQSGDANRAEAFEDVADYVARLIESSEQHPGPPAHDRRGGSGKGDGEPPQGVSPSPPTSAPCICGPCSDGVDPFCLNCCPSTAPGMRKTYGYPPKR